MVWEYIGVTTCVELREVWSEIYIIMQRYSEIKDLKDLHNMYS
jgi:hypothetical protein